MAFIRRLAPSFRLRSVMDQLHSVLSWAGIGSTAALLAGGLIAGYSLWYTSSGHFPAFPEIQNDYVDLGESFLRGKLSLPEQPDSRLADLGNPYEYTQRKGIPYHWDASYFDGKYYLYWGPVPALGSAALQLIGGHPPSASLLVVLPYIGLVAIAITLLFQLSPSSGVSSRLSIWLFIIVGFFNLPLLFTIGQPRHYQASILYGQFFLLTGMLGIVLHTQRRRPIWLLVSGLALGLAFGSRYNLAISIAVYLAFAAWWLWRDRDAASFWGRLALLNAPLALIVLGLGVYNSARFGNPLETGLTYQLTIPEFRQISYSTAYVPSGLYVYLLYPLTPAPNFPFIQAAHFSPALLPDSVFVPPGREFDQVSFGIIATVPALWLFAIVIPLLLARPLGDLARANPQTSGVNPSLVFSMFAVGAAGQFAFLLVFFYVAERYIADFYLPVVLCLAMTVWQAHAVLRRRPFLQATLWTAILILTAWTAAIGYFACFGVPVLVSLYFDPQMLANLAAFWNAGAGALRFLVPYGP